MESYLAQRAAHIASALPGVEAAQTLSAMTDEAVRELSRAASSRLTGRWAILALGGWGAGALLPASDLDILVLSDAPTARLKPFVEAVLYPLWDAGLKVGHQVRSPKQQLKAMRDDLKTCTATLTGRAIAGDVDWAEQTLRSCVASRGQEVHAPPGRDRSAVRARGRPTCSSPTSRRARAGGATSTSSCGARRCSRVRHSATRALCRARASSPRPRSTR